MGDPGYAAPISAVLFDMDGTLVDSDAVVENSWRRWCEIYRIDYDVLITVAHGVPGAVTARRFLPGSSDEEISAAAALALSFEYDAVEGVVPTDGALELISVLDARGVPWAIVTSADLRLAKIRLDAAGIGVPEVLVTSDDVSRGKPDPEGFRAAAAALGVDVATALVVEDSVPGVAAGRAAGARVAALKGLDADAQITTLRALIPVFRSRRIAGQ